MAWKGRAKKPVDFAQLKPILVSAKLQTENYDLYLFLDQLLDKVAQSRDQITTQVEQFTGDINVNNETNLAAILAILAQINQIIQFATFWTQNDESVNLPSSTRVIAGVGITLDYTIANQVTVAATGVPNFPPIYAIASLRI